VAEHCVLAVAILDGLWPGKVELQKAALMHDAAEAYLHDIQGPLRRRVRVHLDDGDISWSESDAGVTANICKQFGISVAHLESPEVHAADILAVSFEKRDCPNLREGDWGLPEIPESIKNLGVFLGAGRSGGPVRPVW